MSTTLTPVLQIPLEFRPAPSVISSNLNSPLFRYNLLETKLPVKKISCNESLLKSPIPTPPPL